MPAFGAGVCHMALALDAGRRDWWIPVLVTSQAPSVALSLFEMVKPLACHVTRPVLAVTSGRRSIFGSASWSYPHPPVTQRVAQPAASCSSALVDMIGWCREEWPSDVPACASWDIRHYPSDSTEGLARLPTWGLLTDCSSFVHGTPGDLPPQ